jgi:CheY-like chemotaxis protein
MSAERVILSIEDQPDSLIGVVTELRASGMQVVQVSDLAEAKEVVRRRRFDLLLVDLRMPDGNSFRVEGGLEFVKAMRSRDYGARNASTPFAIVTAYAHNITREPLLGLKGFMGVISKTDPVIPFLSASVESVLPWFPQMIKIAVPDYIVEDLVVFEGFEDELGNFQVVVGKWPYGETVPVRADSLPPELQQELAYGVRPVFAWAKVNIETENASEVRPHHFRLEPQDREKEMEFDWREHGVDRRAGKSSKGEA